MIVYSSGAAKLRLSYSPIQKNVGFTLIELLVVLVIISIISSIAVMSIGDRGKARSNELDKQVMESRVQYYQKQAILLHQTLGLHISQKQYVFSLFNQKTGSWIFYREQYSFTEPQKTLLIDNELKKIPETLNKTPQVILSPEGLITPFSLFYK